MAAIVLLAGFSLAQPDCDGGGISLPPPLSTHSILPPTPFLIAAYELLLESMMMPTIRAQGQEPRTWAPSHLARGGWAKKLVGQWYHSDPADLIYTQHSQQLAAPSIYIHIYIYCAHPFSSFSFFFKHTIESPLLLSSFFYMYIPPPLFLLCIIFRLRLFFFFTFFFTIKAHAPVILSFKCFPYSNPDEKNCLMPLKHLLG
jgi:hypothetical protein